MSARPIQPSARTRMYGEACIPLKIIKPPAEVTGFLRVDHEPAPQGGGCVRLRVQLLGEVGLRLGVGAIERKPREDIAALYANAHVNLFDGAFTTQGGANRRSEGWS
jgi:hypothetical protein